MLGRRAGENREGHVVFADRAACNVNAHLIQAIEDLPVSERLAFTLDDLPQLRSSTV
jgi:hypothetical protein